MCIFLSVALAPQVQEVLLELGYPAGNPDACAAHLARVFRQAETFPHEIGFFLAYPPDDVIGFIRHQGRDYKAMGLWKVYGDCEQAELLNIILSWAHYR